MNTAIILTLLVSCFNLLLLAVVLFLVQRPDNSTDRIISENNELKDMLSNFEKTILNYEKRFDKVINIMKENSESSAIKTREVLSKKIDSITENR